MMSESDEDPAPAILAVLCQNGFAFSDYLSFWQHCRVKMADFETSSNMAIDREKNLVLIKDCQSVC